MTSTVGNGSMPLRRIDKNNMNIKATEIIGFCCVRNEELRLPYFLEYHKNLGVDRFIIIDNASTDGTLDYLLSQNYINTFFTEDSYAKSRCGVDWLNMLLSKYGCNHWTVTLDADELLIYPMCEDINLHLLTKYLERNGSQGLETFMLDMYSDKPIIDTEYVAGEPFVLRCQYFDSDTYYDFDEYALPGWGGPRQRIFWQDYERNSAPPCLRKAPLVKWRKDLEYEASTHYIRNVRMSLMTGILLHFKLFSDFYKYAEDESERKEHWDNASQYASYWDVLRKIPDLTALYAGSVCYENSLQLVKLGMMRLPFGYEKFVNNLKGKN